MRIAALITQYPPNVTAGLGRYAQVLFPLLARTEEMSVHTMNTGRLRIWERRDGLEVHRPTSWVLRLATRKHSINRETRSGFFAFALGVIETNLRCLPALWVAKRRGQIDLVCAHDSTNFIAMAFVEHVLRVPLVFHVHTTEFGLAPVRSISDPLSLFLRMEKHLARHSRLVVAPTPETAQVLRDNGWGDTDHVRHVVHGSGYAGQERQVDAQRCRRLRAKLGIDPDAPLLVFVGRLHKQKGILPLIRALRVVADRVPDVRLVVVGEGNQDAVRGLVSDLGLGDHVILTGFVDQERLADHYAMADLCVFPSIYEPFGLVAVEAMALARPCVLGSGFSEVFFRTPEQGTPTALRVDESDPESFGDTLVAWLQDAEGARRVGEAGCDWAREQFSWQRACAQTLELYREVLG